MELNSDGMVVSCVKCLACTHTHHLMVVESTYTIASRLPHLLVHVCIQSSYSLRPGWWGWVLIQVACSFTNSQ